MAMATIGFYAAKRECLGTCTVARFCLKCGTTVIVSGATGDIQPRHLAENELLGILLAKSFVDAMIRDLFQAAD